MLVNMKLNSFIVGFFLILCSTLSITLVQTKLIQSRIISGTAATKGQFPWQVVLKKDSYDRMYCGGSIISNLYVLTAGHCTYGLKSILMLFGTIELDDSANNMTSNQFFLHPQYNPKNLNNDISLIKLPSALNFTSTIQPIALVTTSQASQIVVGSTAVIAGFGITDDINLDYSEVLLWATVQIIKNDHCAKIYGNQSINEKHICSKGDGNTNMAVCSGDSGGPLIMSINDNFAQIGIISFVARDRCTERYPSAYVRITSYLDYISNVTGLTLS